MAQQTARRDARVAMAARLPLRSVSKPCSRSRIDLPPQPLHARPALTYLTYSSVVRERASGGCVASLLRFPECQERFIQRIGVIARRHAPHGAPVCQVPESVRDPARADLGQATGHLSAHAYLVRRDHTGAPTMLRTAMRRRPSAQQPRSPLNRGDSRDLQAPHGTSVDLSS